MLSLNIVQGQDNSCGEIIFDLSKYSAEPITCSPKDESWSLSLPPLLNAHGIDVEIQMQTNSRLFTFQVENSVVILNNRNKNLLYNGSLCP